MTPLVLASASPRRRALLAALGVDFDVVTSDAEEVFDGPTNAGIVETNAIAKRDDVAARLEGPSVVIGADTLVFLDHHILGKPANTDEAKAMLRTLSGKTHQVLTGIAVADMSSGREAVASETTDVTFRTLSEDEIDRFCDIVNPVDRAGAYTVDGPGSLLVAGYRGCYQNVLGFPMVRLDLLLREIGVSLFARMRPDRASFL